MASPRRALRAALYVLGVFSLVSLCGSLTPREHIAMQTVELPAPPAEVYAAVRDFEAAPTWRTGLDRVEVLPDRNDRVVYREIGDDGAITFQVTDDRPNQRLVTEIADVGLAFSGHWVFQFAEAEGGGTRLTLTEVGDVPNPVLRFLANTTFGFEGGIEQYLADLRTHLSKRGA
jgi:uncharacterized membrane protein